MNRRTEIMRLVRSECDRIHDAADQIELAVINIDDDDTWREALVLVEAASTRIYETKKKMLKEAVARSRERNTDARDD